MKMPALPEDEGKELTSATGVKFSKGYELSEMVVAILTANEANIRCEKPELLKIILNQELLKTGYAHR